MNLENCAFKQISESHNEILTEAFSEAEVKKAVWECDSAKSPGPDGVNLGFVKDFRGELKVDFVNLLSEFHANGCNYKMVAKVLANRLKKVIVEVISENQYAFIEGRQILDVLSALPVYRDISDRGLGVKNLKIFNMALIGKWLWRFKSDNNDLWVEVLGLIYGNLVCTRRETLGKDSILWRDLESLDRTRWGVRVNWFLENLDNNSGSGWSWGGSKGIWHEVCYWMNLHIDNTRDLAANFENFTSLLGERGRSMKYLTSIWADVAWTIWKARNNIIFKGKDLEIDSLFEEAKILPWSWIRYNSKRFWFFLVILSVAFDGNGVLALMVFSAIPKVSAAEVAFAIVNVWVGEISLASLSVIF
ncbi:unnamed protein product [Vicia faba]|uniref:Uncharacterized protein n=1 Tax=Vicia faba TaxID=3906 RepID=A0AAV0ZBD5_VICFA|nr:unnamed protein product [Vicia faba]